jgi:hypothetical protein
MDQVCHNWLSWIVNAKGDWGGSSSPQIANSYNILNENEVIGRYFEISPAGFVFVPVVKEMIPVKAYSETSRLNFSAPGGMSALIKDVMTAQIADFVRSYGSIDVPQPTTGTILYDPAQRETWINFLKTDKEFTANLNSKAKETSSTIGPLLTTTWHQFEPYNELCPIGDYGRCVVGCVATAASQILAYHKWPPEGKGQFTYYWAGDTYCDGVGVYPYIPLTADYSDPYDWPNIPNTCAANGPLAQRRALSELCYEVGVAFMMQYSSCGSGAYVPDGLHIFPHFFRYKDNIVLRLHPDYRYYDWASLIRQEMLAGRPISYRIKMHAIVCDGFQEFESVYYCHMNYGWVDGNQTAWYGVDNLYCNWEGCSVSEEYMLTNIEPDRRAYFSADTAWGEIPLTVNFTGHSSNDPVDRWIWYFGDGDSSLVQSPTHIFEHPGSFDITLKTISGTDTGIYIAENKIAALSDSLTGGDNKGLANKTIEIVVNGFNSAALKKIVIPVTYSGPLNLQYLDYSIAGCRTNYFNYIAQPCFDLQNHRTAFVLENTNQYELDLEPGYGPLLKLYFSIPASAKMDQIDTISFASFPGYAPSFTFGNGVIYTPNLSSGLVSLAFACGDANHDGRLNLLDVSFIINDLYRGGPDPEEPQAADVNSDGKINLLDISYIINYMYRGGPAPDCTM